MKWEKCEILFVQYVFDLYDLLCEEGGEFRGTELHLKIVFVRIQSWFHLRISFFHGPPN